MTRVEQRWTTQNIRLPIDPETAQDYQAIDPETQQELLLFLVTELKRKLQIKKLHNAMDALGAEAQANGLTPEILESILALKKMHRWLMFPVQSTHAEIRKTINSSNLL